MAAGLLEWNFELLRPMVALLCVFVPSGKGDIFLQIGLAPLPFELGSQQEPLQTIPTMAFNPAGSDLAAAAAIRGHSIADWPSVWLPRGRTDPVIKVHVIPVSALLDLEPARRIAQGTKPFPLHAPPSDPDGGIHVIV